tara:strand:+ start:1587 stop:2708 length:1122 start_codon:yes stop_codon:yes gene_type:complete
MIDKKITYFYQAGRKEKLLGKEKYAKEMFYGYHYFQKKFNSVNIVEFLPIESKIRKLFRNKIEKKLSNFFKLPLYWTYMVTKKNRKIIKESDYVVLNNNRMGASIMPLFLWNNVMKKKQAVSLCFVLGLFSRKTKFKFLMFFHNLYIRSILKNIDKFIFLSEGELDFAKKKFKQYKKKFYLLPFAVDLDIWNIQEHNKEGILFVGNDGFRDFRLVEKIINSLPEINFSVVSEFIKEENLVHKNFKIYNGSWGNPAISDLELRDLYASSKLTIIPLINSLQPSGQSVALQSIACGTPVIISQTDGFWDKANFKNGLNIVFNEDNLIETWKSNILNLYKMNNNNYKEIVDNGLDLINKKYNLDDFSKKIESILFS